MKHNRAHYNAAITLWLLPQYMQKKQYKYQDTTLAYLLNITFWGHFFKDRNVA